MGEPNIRLMNVGTMHQGSSELVNSAITRSSSHTWATDYTRCRTEINGFHELVTSVNNW